MDTANLLDLFCGEGGAGAGYQRAGFRTYGVDREARAGRRYPGPFHRGDVIDVLTALIRGDAVDFIHPGGAVEWMTLDDFAAVHASPPCQAYSIATAGNPAAREKHLRLIDVVRDFLTATGLLWVIENVEQARSEMRDPVMLCGRQFGLQAHDTDGVLLTLDRHRLFEANFTITAPAHPPHAPAQVAGVYGGARRSSKPNATPADDRYAARHERRGGYVPRSKDVQAALLGIDWMTVKGLQESIPPAYAEYVGSYLKRCLGAL